MENTMITFKWYSGHMDVLADELLTVAPAQLKKMIKVATENMEEVQDALSALINDAISALNPKYSLTDKKNLERYKKLLDVAGGKKATKAEKTLAKIVKNMPMEMWKGVFIQNGKYCVLDGYRAFRLSAPVSGIDRIEREYDFSIIEKNEFNKELALPSAKDLKADIKMAKEAAASGTMHIGCYHIDRCGRKITVMYDFGYGLPMVNAEYLLDMLDVLPDCRAYIVQGSTTNPIYFVSGDSDGVLLPMRKEREYEEAPAEEKTAVGQNHAAVDAETVTETQEENRMTNDTAEAWNVTEDAENVAEDDEWSDIRPEVIKAALESGKSNVDAMLKQAEAIAAAWEAENGIDADVLDADSPADEYAIVCTFRSSGGETADMGIRRHYGGDREAAAAHSKLAERYRAGPACRITGYQIMPSAILSGLRMDSS